MAEEKVSRRHITDEGLELVRRLFDAALRIDHKTAWMHQGAQLQSGDGAEIFVYWTIKPETAQAARKALDEAGCLCDTDLGPIHKMENGEVLTFIADPDWKKDGSGKLGHESADLDEASFLKKYRERKYPRPSVTVDLVVFTVVDTDLKVLLVKRKGHPFQGCWALPGGFLHAGNTYDDQGEDLEAAAHRELAEETGLPEQSCYLEQLYTFGNAYRDPRTRVISVAYFALIRPDLAAVVQAGSDAEEARWMSVRDALDLKDDGLTAFDHAQILQLGVDRIRGKLDFSDVAFKLVPETFTVAELRGVYQAITGLGYDPANFRRKFRRMVKDGTIEEATGVRQTATKPAKVYRFSGQ
jgi:8-oxo-dGTP diphosphatase